MTTLTLASLGASLLLSIAIYSLGRRNGYRAGAFEALIHSAASIEAFLQWLDADDRLHFKSKLRQFNTYQLLSRATEQLDAPKDGQ